MRLVRRHDAARALRTDSAGSRSLPGLRRAAGPRPALLPALRHAASAAPRLDRGVIAGDVRTRHRSVGGRAQPAEPGAAEPTRERSPEIFPLARAAAVSILLMLGLGAVFGASLRPGGVASLARGRRRRRPSPPPAPITVANTPDPSPSTGGGGSSGGGSSSGGGRLEQPAASGGPAAASGTGGLERIWLGQRLRLGQRFRSGRRRGPEPATKLPLDRPCWEIASSSQGYAQSFGTTKGRATTSPRRSPTRAN